MLGLDHLFGPLREAAISSRAIASAHNRARLIIYLKVKPEFSVSPGGLGRSNLRATRRKEAKMRRRKDRLSVRIGNSIEGFAEGPTAILALVILIAIVLWKSLGG